MRNRITLALSQWDALRAAERQRAASEPWELYGIGMTPDEGNDDADDLAGLMATDRDAVNAAGRERDRLDNMAAMWAL